MDYYHYWGVAHAQSFAEVPLGSPYSGTETYAAVLNAHSERSDDALLRATNAQRRTLDLTGTPVFYTAMALVPRDFASGLGAFRALLTIAFIGAVMLLGHNSGDGIAVTTFALVLALAFEPLRIDVRVGNVNSIQLLLVTCIAAGTQSIVPSASQRLQTFVAFLMIVMLGFMAAWKPNVFLLVALLSVSLWLRAGSKIVLRAAIPASVATIALFLAPCVFFRSLAVWGDWLGNGIGRGITYRLESGNFSTPVLLDRWLNTGKAAAIVIILLLLFGSATLVAREAVRRRGVSWGEVSQQTGQLLHDPRLAMALGVVLMLALMPLVWVHYYVLAAAPVVFLFVAPDATKIARGAAAAGLVLSSGLLPGLSRLATGEPVSPDLRAAWYGLGWIALWTGLLAIASGRLTKGAETVARLEVASP